MPKLDIGKIEVIATFDEGEYILHRFMEYSKPCEIIMVYLSDLIYALYDRKKVLQ